MIKKFILAIMLGLSFSSAASAAGWGALQKGQCQGFDGTRKYSAKIWTGLGDKKASFECRNTRNKVGRRTRVPDKCEDHIGGISYGIWFEPDKSCPGYTSVPRLKGPNEPDPDFIEVTKERLSPKVIAEYVEGSGYKINIKWLKVAFEDPRIKPLVDNMLKVWNELSELQEIITATENAIALQKVLLSSDPNAIAVRTALIKRDDRAAAIALHQIDEFHAAKPKKSSAYINAISITLIDADASYLFGATFDLTLVIGWMDEVDTLGAMWGSGLGITGGASKGADLGMAIGVWTDTLDDMQGSNHGFTAAFSANEIGYNLNVEFGYPDECKFMYASLDELRAQFKGFVLGFQTPTSKEVEYVRTHFAALRYGKIIDPAHPNFNQLVKFEDDYVSIQPC